MSTVQQFLPPRSRVVADLTAARAQDVAEDKADARMIEKMTQPKSAQEAKAHRDEGAGGQRARVSGTGAPERCRSGC